MASLQCTQIPSPSELDDTCVTDNQIRKTKAAQDGEVITMDVHVTLMCGSGDSTFAGHQNARNNMKTFFFFLFFLIQHTFNRAVGTTVFHMIGLRASDIKEGQIRIAN